MLNGTLREFDTRFKKKYCIVRLVLWNIVDRQNPDHAKPRCQNCAATTHKTWECSEAKKISPEIVCDNCGNAGHPTFDCKVVQSIDRYLFSKANRSGWEDGYQQRGLKSTVSNVGPGVSDFSLSSVSIFLPRYCPSYNRSLFLARYAAFLHDMNGGVSQVRILLMANPQHL